MLDKLWLVLCALAGFQAHDIYRPGDGRSVPFYDINKKLYYIVPFARLRRWRWGLLGRYTRWGRYDEGKEGLDRWGVTDEDGEFLEFGPVTYGQAIDFIWKQVPDKSNHSTWINATGDGFATDAELKRFFGLSDDASIVHINANGEKQ